MRNLKKFLALVLATMMLLSVAVVSVNAADEADYTDAANHLAALQVMKGNENGDLMLENGVTRYQAALFFVQALTGETDVAVWNAEKKSAVFTDVPEYGTAIDHANGIGIVKGRGNGIFGYNDAITYQDMLVMAVRALGYETEGMSYPYGYILAAQKLGLTENVANVNYKAALTRGETAQIIWDMLGTEIAVVDSLTDKILYPGESGLTDAILATNPDYVAPERVTLLEDSGLAGDKIEATIVEFVEADEDDEESFDTVELSNGLVLAAADFGITAETRKVTYMGLPVEIFISVDEEDFTQEAYDDEDATVVFASFPTYTSVLNLADGNVKFVENTTDVAKSYFSFGGNKLTVGKYAFVVGAFVDGMWTVVDNGAGLAANFAYDTKDGYAEGVNAYAQISYRVTDNIVTDEETGDEYTIVEVLYTPFEFGQYNVREINGEKYTVIASYEDTAVTNLDEETTNFVEYLVDGSVKVTVNTTKISAKKGEAALTVAVEGAAVEAGDFMFYAYNETDNVLTVAANAGKFETGRLTAQNTTKSTVKVNGTNYELGFVGYDAEWAAAFDSTANKGFISALEAGKDNVKFLVVNGNIVYMVAATEETTASTFDFAIVSTDPEIMADLLGMTEEKYEAAIEDTCGLYVDGTVKVAMLDLATGEWVLADIAGYNTEWDADEAEFVNEYTDLKDAIKYYDITGNTEKYGYLDDLADLVAGGMVAVVAEDDGAYTIAANEDDFFVYGDTEDGLLFSDNSAKTNAITADNDVDAARVTVTDETVIVVLGVDGIGTRTGIQAANNSIEYAGKFYAASSNLIVFETGAEAFVVADWAGAATANSDENWFITTLTTGVEVEAGETEEDPYIVTITDLYDMKAQAIVESIQTEVEDLDDVLAIEEVGTVLFKNASDEITVLGAIDEVDFADIIVEVANDNEDKLEYTYTDAFNWIDVDTVEVGDITKAEAVDVTATVITLDLTGLDAEDYDFDGIIASAKDFVTCDGEHTDACDCDLNNEYKVGYETLTFGETEVDKWAYVLENELVDEITEPTEGIYDSYIANNDAEIYVPAVDSDDYNDAATVNVNLYIAYNVEDGVINVVIYKVID